MRSDDTRVEGETRDDASPGARLRRLRMRAWRRGTREMDLILGPFADARLDVMTASELDAFEAVLSENDQDLYAWVSGAARPPAERLPMLDVIAEFARVRFGTEST